MSDIGLVHIQEAVTIAKLDDFTGSYKELGAGGVNDVFLLDCGERQVVLRVTRYHDVINLGKEAAALAMLNLENVPKLIFFDESKRIMDRVWILESYVQGTTPVVMTSDEYASLGSLLANIHKVESLESKPVDLWADFIYAAKRFGDEQRLLNHPDDELRGLIRRAKTYLIEETKKYGYVRECLIHGDATPGNTLTHANKVGLIDWEFSRFKDPMSDFSTAFYEDMEANRGKWRVRLSPEQKAAFYEGYQQAGGEIDEERIGMWMNLDKLGLVVYLSWLVNESGRRDHSSEKIEQYLLDITNLKSSLDKNLPR